MFKILLIDSLVAVLSSILLASPGITLGLLWHDGAFAPFAMVTMNEIEFGLMRNGTGGGDGFSYLLLWIGFETENVWLGFGEKVELYGGDMWVGESYQLGWPEVVTSRPFIGIGFFQSNVLYGMLWVKYASLVGFPMFRFEWPEEAACSGS